VPRNEFQSIIQGIEEQMLLTQLCNPGEGSRVPRLQCYQARFQGFAGFQDSTVAGFQYCKAAKKKLALLIDARLFLHCLCICDLKTGLQRCSKTQTLPFED
jgi:hypothetical protein